ncbi:MAG: leucyl/phenylalanyl-tRNA--protein transferase [SAR324 cluster bacterium]|nr:leucyl/phenylalanyl-tRNA--protein transferase [SAR324 cluster bacterium]
MPLWLNEASSPIFPPVERLDPEHTGIVAVNGDFSIERLINAYANGIFPWPSDYGLLWHSPDPRYVLFTDDAHLSRSLLKQIRSGRFETRFDTNFASVIRLCSEERKRGTWILPEMQTAYTRLHELGYAHSAETYDAETGELIGGLYGVSIGKSFAGESCFFRRDNAGKIAFAALVAKLGELGIPFMDCQMETPLSKGFGGVFVSRKQYLTMLRRQVQQQDIPKNWMM